MKDRDYGPTFYDRQRAEGETRHTDPETGYQKGQKPSQLSAIDPLALEMLGRVAGNGIEKHGRYDYLTGYDWHLFQDAGARHNLAFWAGEDLDPESGLPHPVHEAWNALAKLSFYLRHIGTDDRPPKK